MSKGMTGIFVPNAILLDRELTSSEKLVLSEIHYLSKGEMGCIATNAHFASLTGFTTTHISTMVSKLRNLGRVSSEPAYTVSGRKLTSNVRLEGSERISMAELRQADVLLRGEARQGEGAPPRMRGFIREHPRAEGI